MVSQLQIINKILQTKDMSLVLLNNLSEDHFFSYPAEFKFLKNHYDLYRTVPDRITFVNAFNDFDIVDVAEPDIYLIEQLFKDYNSRNIASSFTDIRRMLENDDIDGAMIKLEEAANTMHQGSAMTCTDLLTDHSRYDRYLDRVRNSDKYYIKTGFVELDNLIGGIDVMDENMVIAARTGVGKSWTLIKIAVEAAKQGRTVGLYSGEMSPDKVGYRFDTLLGHINNSAITRGKDTDPAVPEAYKAYLSKIKNYCTGTVKVLTPNDIQGPATVGALRTFVEKEGIDILLIDQYSLLEDQHKAKIMHEKVANISKDVKNLQVMKRIPIISVSQMNRTKNEDKSQDTTQIGLSDRIGQDATTIIMLDREVTYMDEAKTRIADDRLILNVVKSRDGGSGKLAYKADFDRGFFTYLDPSMSEEAADELRSQYEDTEDDTCPW